MMEAQPIYDRTQKYPLVNERKRKRILVADSDRVHCLILSLLLEDEGFLVTTCRHTPTAISLIRTKPFDFVISEHSTIGVNGVQVLETAKRVNWNIPVLLTAALCEMETYIEAMHRGALDYICKPNYGEIKRIVRENCWK
jgi:two-component system nitrogen regulation response regulator NtrX